MLKQSTRWMKTNNESESCEYLSYHSPSIGIGDANGSHACQRLAGSSIVLTQDKQAVSAADPIVRKGPASNESLVSLTHARSFLFSVTAACMLPDHPSERQWLQKTFGKLSLVVSLKTQSRKERHSKE
jgi:hypothetical protein